MGQTKYFYCYSPILNQYLHDECGYKYITKGIHISSKAEYWMYEKTNRLSKSVDFFNFLTKRNK